MVLIDLNHNTLAMLIAGLYCSEHQVNAIAIPHSVWIAVAEKLEWLINMYGWDTDKISFEEWVDTHLLILPKPMIDEKELEDLKDSTLYWEYPNGNVILVVSMDIKFFDEEST